MNSKNGVIVIKPFFYNTYEVKGILDFLQDYF